ncbi:MAG: DUF6624 domain-containing protein [Solimonas sp.]
MDLQRLNSGLRRTRRAGKGHVALRLVPGTAGLLAALLLSMPAHAAPAADPAYRTQVLALARADREERAALTPATSNDDAVQRALAEHDLGRWQTLEGLIKAKGFPGTARVGSDGAQAAFLVIQHLPDPDAQATLLPAAEEAWRNRQWPGAWYAQLYDRVQIHAGRPQRYGSQYSFDDNGEISIDPVEDALRLDARRISVDLPPMAQYLQSLQAQGYKVSRFSPVQVSPAAAWQAGFGGVGPITLGMNLRQAIAASSLPLTVPDIYDSPDCTYAAAEHADGMPPLMLANGLVVRYDVIAAPIRTARGIGVGNTEAQVIAAYGKASVGVTAHAYGGVKDHYLTVYSPDRRQALRFEIEGGVVTRYYGGWVKQVAYTEGCL